MNLGGSIIALLIDVMVVLEHKGFALTPRGGWFFALSVVGLLLAGCYEYRVKYDGWETFRNQLGADPAGGNPSSRDPRDPYSVGTTRQNTGWSILVQSFEGGSRYRKANELIRKLTNLYAVTELWLQEQDGKTKVYRGRYTTLTDLDAQQALLQTRAIEEDGERPYENVELVSLGGEEEQRVTGSGDLRAYTGQGFYTLQIGFYDEDFGPDFRDAAEQAVATLREEGQRVFYYHGPNRSMMMVELFSDADFEQDGPVRVYGSRMLSLQERFPHNLCNGRTILESIGDGKKVEKRPQPSFIVKVP